jgi:hypothetical protein
VQCCTPIISALRRQRQEDLEFKASLGYKVRTCLKKQKVAGHWWLMPVILATQEVEIRRIAVRSQPRQIVCDI